jgi:hypothetical protein
MSDINHLKEDLFCSWFQGSVHVLWQGVMAAGVGGQEGSSPLCRQEVEKETGRDQEQDTPKGPLPVIYFLLLGPTSCFHILPNSASHWGPNVQPMKPVGDISYLNPNRWQGQGLSEVLTDLEAQSLSSAAALGSPLEGRLKSLPTKNLYYGC